MKNNTIVNLTNIDKNFFANMEKFHENYVERAIIKNAHSTRMKDLKANLKKAKNARTDLEKDSILEELKAITRENEQYKKVIKPYNNAIREVLKTVPDGMYDGYEYAVKKDSYGRLIDRTKEFLLSAGIVEKDAGTVKRFSQSIINSIGKKNAGIDDMVENQSYFKTKSKTIFKELYLLAFLEMCNKNGLTKATFSAKTTNKDVLEYIGKTTTATTEPTTTATTEPTTTATTEPTTTATITAESNYRELQKALKNAGLSAKGKKDDLVKRCEENGLFNTEEKNVPTEPTTTEPTTEVYENARVSDNAEVSGDAEVSCDAKVSGDTTIDSDTAKTA